MLPLFSNAALLAGLAGIAAPVLIHLLLRRRSQRLRFSTIQFFVKKDEQSTRKRKLRNLFLLALRVMLFTLVVLAFARPYLPSGTAPNAKKRQQVVLLLDSSASLQSTGTGGSQWRRAKEKAGEILRALQPDDLAALVVWPRQGTIDSSFFPPSILTKKLADLEPGFGSADLGEGAREALKLLPAKSPALASSFYIISDFQRGGAENLSSVPLPKDLPVRFIDLGDRFIPNVAVTELRLNRESARPPHAVITSFSDESYSGLKYHFRIDGKEVFSGQMALPSLAGTNLPLAMPGLQSGWHSAEFSIEAKDGFAADDSAYASLFVAEPIRCLVVEPRGGERPYLEESYFVATALNPSGSGANTPARFVYEKTSPDDLASKLQPQPGKPRYELVVLPACKQISQAAPALKAFVNQGGGLMVFLGEGISANAYNSELAELLPAELLRVDRMSENPWHMAKMEKASPLFELFREAGSGNLTLPEFTGRFTLRKRAEAVLGAEFDDGEPFILDRKVGAGRVVLLNTSADTKWTDWQKRKTFVPWIHSAAAYLTSRAEADRREISPAFSAGLEV
ncbi:MAG TPA: BatA and WFA domain-containing protein, partial [Verrucomicrobiae bacterium]|nr:BatA and WFA domain-containing protein [Verrucomicrobiae bacterium]